MRALAGLVAAAACLVALSGCSGSSGGGSDVPNTIGPQSSLAESKGFRCEDPKSDLGSAVKGVGTASEPAGIDMVVAEAKVENDALVVTYQMAGDPNTAPQPFVDLLQGDITAPDFSFELRGAPIAGTPTGSPWGLTLITFKGGEQRKALATAVTVSGNTVSYQVPLADLPPIATLQWTFGTSSTSAGGTVVFDDCSSLTAQPGGDTTTTSQP